MFISISTYAVGRWKFQSLGAEFFSVVYQTNKL